MVFRVYSVAPGTRCKKHLKIKMSKPTPINTPYFPLTTLSRSSIYWKTPQLDLIRQSKLNEYVALPVKWNWNLNEAGTAFGQLLNYKSSIIQLCWLWGWFLQTIVKQWGIGWLPNAPMYACNHHIIISNTCIVCIYPVMFLKCMPSRRNPFISACWSLWKLILPRRQREEPFHAENCTTH